MVGSQKSLLLTELAAEWILLKPEEVQKIMTTVKHVNFFKLV